MDNRFCGSGLSRGITNNILNDKLLNGTDDGFHISEIRYTVFCGKQHLEIKTLRTAQLLSVGKFILHGALHCCRKEEHDLPCVRSALVPIDASIIACTERIIPVEGISEDVYGNGILRKQGDGILYIVHHAGVCRSGHNERNIPRVLILFFESSSLSDMIENRTKGEFLYRGTGVYPPPII